MNGCNFHCCSCYVQLSYLRDHVEIKPCRCVMCPKCLLMAHAERGGAALTCPGCHSVEVRAHEYIKAMEASGAGEVVTYRSPAPAAAVGRGAAPVEEAGDDDIAGEFNVDDNEKEEREGGEKQEEEVIAKLTPKQQKPTADAPLGRYPNGRKRTARPLCKIEGCTKFVQSQGLCTKHGAKKYYKYCTIEGCTSIAMRDGICIKHGAKITKKRCKHEGCTLQVVNNGACSRHGGVRPLKPICSVEGCERRVARFGLCPRHGGKQVCKIEGCEKYAQRGGVCQQHSPDAKPPFKECVKEGCTNRTRNGTCKKHCKSDGCTNKAIRFGLCHSHGGHKVLCSVDGCFELYHLKGMCRSHYKEQQKKENEVAAYIDADDGLHPVGSSSLLPEEGSADVRLPEEGLNNYSSLLPRRSWQTSKS